MRQAINYEIINKLPKDHFGPLTQKVLSHLLSGKCCSVTGQPGFGMEFFAKQIAVLLEGENPDALILMMNLELKSDVSTILEKYLLTYSNAPSLEDQKFISYLNSHKVIIILSEVFTPPNNKLIKFLNSVRWLSKDNFTVLTVANYCLVDQTQKFLEYGNDLFFPIYKIAPFDLSGVKRIISLNNSEYKWNTPERLIPRIFVLSGGNPSLVKYICMALYEEGEELVDNLEKLIKFLPLNKRLSDLADMLFKLSVEDLSELSVITTEGKLFSEILTFYLNLREPAYFESLYPNLTSRERQLLFVFIINKGNLLTKDQISLCLGQSLDTYSEWAIYKAINRLRAKLSNQETIKTVKGKGWIYI